MEALRKILPGQSTQGPQANGEDQDTLVETSLQQHHKNIMRQEENIREEVRQKFKRARDLGNMFKTFLAHISFLFMEV